MPGPILKPGDTVDVWPTTEPFIAQDHFVLNIESRDQILISLIGGDFLRWFHEKREIPAGPATLRSYELQDNAGDATIVAELGGEQKAETTLAQVFWLLERQKRGERGALANNGWGNLWDLYT
ncbi:MAG TPA: hypothetical protein VN841_26735 [Bryobacteraceae bacterium]|nr:hypothetical protein [Bryobacteraceae bacterium]